MGNCCETERNSTPKPPPPSSAAKPSALSIPFSNHILDSASPVVPRRSSKALSPLLALPSEKSTKPQISTEQAEAGLREVAAPSGRRMLKLRTAFSVHFDVIRDLRRDQFCIISLMEQKQTRRQVVFKKVEKQGTVSASSLISRELAIGSRLDHPNVLKTLEVYHDGSAVYMVSEGLLSDPVLDFASIRHLSQSTALQIVYQVLATLKYSHAKLIPHLNISPEHLLVQIGRNNSDILVKVAGFGSQLSALDSISVLFRAPELLKELPGTEKADIWACGVLLYYLLSKDLPFLDTDAVLSGKPNFQQIYWEKSGATARILISNMLDQQASARPSASECMAHSLFHAPAFEVSADFLCPSLDCLRTAVPRGELSQAIISYMSSFVRDSGQIKSAIADFKALDTDEDGEISLSELEEGYYKAGYDREEAANLAKTVVQTVGTAPGGSITYSEFLYAQTDLASLLSRENLRLVYAALHASASSQLRLKYLQVHIQGRNEENTNRLWQKLWEKCGFKKERRLTCEDFVELLKSSDIEALE